MAGIFGDEINNRAEFFQVLEHAQTLLKRVLARAPEEHTLENVQKQLEAIVEWTAGGRTPLPSERSRLTMSLRMFREYEMTDDVEIHQLRKLVSGLHSYVDYWPDDVTAADEMNDEYLDDEV